MKDVRIVSVISVRDGFIQNSESFIINGEDSAKIKEAEELFLAKIKEEADEDLTDEQLNDIVNDGYYEQRFDANCSIQLIWSDKIH